MLSTSQRIDLTSLGPLARPYQLEDTRRTLKLLHRFRAALLGHEPGLGKCLMSLMIAANLDARRILIICPAVARLVWEEQVGKWTPGWSTRLVIVRPGTRPKDLSQRLAATNAICVLAYDEFGAAFPDRDLAETILGQATFDLGIFDEAHFLKSFGAARTQRIYDPRGVAYRCAKVLLLTGTPTPNGAQELYSHLVTFWPQLIQIRSRHGAPRPMSQAEWDERVTVTKPSIFGPRYIGNMNASMVKGILDQVMIRRTKKDVLPELPPVVARDIPLDLSLMDLNLTLETRQLHAKLTAALSRCKDNTDEMLRQLRLAPNHPDAVPLASLRRQLANAKVDAVVEWVAPRLDNNSAAKFVFFGWHVAALERLHARLAQYSPVLLTGDTNDKGRAEAIQSFQDNPRCRVFVGQLAACGTAVTLTAGSECAFIECAWTPGTNEQAIGRLHRLGQRDSVLASFLYVPGTVDETVMKVFRRKATGIREFID